MTSPSGKYLRPAQRRKRLEAKQEYIEFIRNDCEFMLDFLDFLQEDEHSMTQSELNSHLNLLWYSLRLMELHIRDILE